ncbi:hypothetical protein DU478_00620 [Thalassococcus profundi]|uniref:Sacsin/Nov domain-containing protein n=1 Tax=Thalassococcus profundi TaxID=2282382 RepID=A0A369TRV9_9RHOB|nr:hypothetical protein [Thalassococcus profundi]RDD68018.1 hypothetical protein DU478_00620 [Thalassococcus profundi]
MTTREDKHQAIERVRGKRKKLADVLRDEEYAGIRHIVEELYPDSAHFIFELLQNAEDTGATEVHFELRRDGLLFQHNGRPFSEEDIFGITNIGKGTKANDVDTIGRFGVGFKAVFAYTESPRIWSPTYSFEINELVLPSLLSDRSDLQGKTRFEFPFNNPKKPREVAYKEVEGGLRDLAETTLLFLNHLQAISWKVGDSGGGTVLRIEHTENHIEVLKETNGETTASSHFLRFTQPVEGLTKETKHKVATAFALEFLPDVKAFDSHAPIAKQMKIVPIPGQVAVFFPAEKETSGLRFHLHAPFVPELSRASIKETPANEPLFEQLAGLAAASLHEVRDHGLLTLDFLSVLPNKQDSIPARYKAIRTAIIDEMNNEVLTPTHGKSHAPAKRLLQAKASLKSLLSEKDLEFLVEDADAPPIWSVGATQKNSEADRFLDSLEIQEWGLDEFVDMLADRTSRGQRYVPRSPYFVSGPDGEFMEWLSSKPNDWHQQLYALLYSELASEGGLYQFTNSKIVRLFSGEYGVGKECFFPDEGDQDDSDLPRVTAEVYTSGRGKAQQHNARKFLEEIGVRVVGEAEQVELILKKRYTRDAEIPSEKKYKKDFKRFVALVEKESSTANLFKGHFVFKCEDDQWHTPNSVYLDTPFLDTGLRAYYDAQADEAEESALDSLFYQNIGVPTKKVAAFARAIGAIGELQISTCRCYQNPEWSYLSQVGGERHTSPIDRDYEIEGLADLLKNPTLALSRLVWRTMAALPNDGRHLVATYRRNASAGSRQAASSLVHVLRSAAWVPQGQESFVRPAEASRDALPEGFPFDPGQRWLKAVKWGEDVVKRSEQQRQKETFARELGFSDLSTLERAKRFASLPPEEQERFLTDWERNAAHELPDHSPANPERRASRVGEMAADAPERRTEERTRSVSVGREDVKAEAGQYLLQQYVTDDELFCQVCKKPMPFKLDDGSAYFERVEFLSGLKKRHLQNYLALCPNHAAMFRHANSTKDFMLEMFLELAGNELEVVLAQENATIYFTKTHIADLKTIIEVDASSDDDSDQDVLAS